MSSTSTQQQQQQSCSVCSSPIKISGAARVCSLRCSWKTKQQCVQCGRQVKNEKLPFADHPDFKIFCGALCLDEARRGNWCIACGVKQVTTQGLSRCSHECMAVDVPLPHESPFPSRRTTPGEGENQHQSTQQNQNQTQQFFNNNNNNNNGNNNNNNNSRQLSRRASFSSSSSSSLSTTANSTSTSMMQMMTNNSNNNSSNNNTNSMYYHPHHQHENRRPTSRELQQTRVTCSPVQPGSKLWERITTPFHRSGLQCFQVIQVHNNATDKKAYNAYRLSVDQNLSSNGIKKYGFGGEGNEHKRFVPLMAGCGGHLYGLRLASQLPPNQHTSSATNHKEIGCEIEGYPFVCQDPACDVCRILEHGMKLTSVTGRTSHFSVPTLDAVLPWCQDASAHAPSQQQQQQQQQQADLRKFQAVALVRTVLGNVNVVSDFDSVPETEPPQGFDSVVCVEENNSNNNNLAAKTDSAFNYNDRGILCEYVVLFSS